MSIRNRVRRLEGSLDAGKVAIPTTAVLGDAGEPVAVYRPAGPLPPDTPWRHLAGRGLVKVFRGLNHDDV